MSCLREDYEGTKYQVYDILEPIEIFKTCQSLDDLLMKHHAFEWAFITACNPRSKVLTDAENLERHLQLKALVKDYLSFEGEGVGNDPDWKPEKSLLILGIKMEFAVRIGMHFEQNAIVVGCLGQAAELLELFDFE
jgi:hypothetical protein